MPSQTLGGQVGPHHLLLHLACWRTVCCMSNSCHDRFKHNLFPPTSCLDTVWPIWCLAALHCTEHGACWLGFCRSNGLDARWQLTMLMTCLQTVSGPLDLRPSTEALPLLASQVMQMLGFFSCSAVRPAAAAEHVHGILGSFTQVHQLFISVE